MDRLLSGLALFATLAIAAPIWAQTPLDQSAPGTPSRSSPHWAQPAPASGEEAASRRMRRHRHYVHHSRGYDSRWRSPADHMANRLNRRELTGGGWYGAAPAYYGAYGPRPYSPSGY